MLDSSLMQLMWLASPALPIGGFSYSECLEVAVDTGLVATESGAKDWLIDQLHMSVARSDLAAVAEAIAGWRLADPIEVAQKIAALNHWVLHTRESSELRAQTEQMGRSLLEWLRNHTTASADHIALLAALHRPLGGWASRVRRPARERAKRRRRSWWKTGGRTWQGH